MLILFFFIEGSNNCPVLAGDGNDILFEARVCKAFALISANC